MVLIQVGGFGIMTMATLLAILAGGRLGLSQTLVAQSETSATTMGNVKGILRTVGITVVLVEAVVAFVLAIRFYVGYGYSVGQSLWQGVFHSISAFNNAGFALFSDNLISFNQDIYIIGPICAAIVAGGLGFPVFYELYRRSVSYTHLDVYKRQAPDWARSTRPLVVVFILVSAAVTLAFKANVDAQAGAYATGVLALMTSAAVAVFLTELRRGHRLAASFFAVVSAVFIYTIVVTIKDRPEGLWIALMLSLIHI